MIEPHWGMALVGFIYLIIVIKGFKVIRLREEKKRADYKK